MSSGSSYFSVLFGATGSALGILSRNFDESATSIAASFTRGTKRRERPQTDGGDTED
jgi:hypothetical protein